MLDMICVEALSRVKETFREIFLIETPLSQTPAHPCVCRQIFVWSLAATMLALLSQLFLYLAQSLSRCLFFYFILSMLVLSLCDWSLPRISSRLMLICLYKRMLELVALCLSLVLVDFWKSYKNRQHPKHFWPPISPNASLLYRVSSQD